MKILHIFRSKPDVLTGSLVEAMSLGAEGKMVSLYLGKVNYDRLINDIFAADHVISWW